MPLVCTTKELVSNPGFDHGLSGWKCVGCKALWVPQGMDGTAAVKIIRRSAKWSRLGSMVPVEKLHYYYYTAYISILAEKVDKKPYYQVEAVVKTINEDRSFSYSVVGITPRVQPGTGFRKVGGDFFVKTDAMTAEIYIRISDLKVQYLIDNVSVTEIFPHPEWRRLADARIEKYRKSNVDIRLTGTCEEKDYQLTLTEEKYHFGFGACVKGRLMANPKEEIYRQFIYKNFNWAVLENALKWGKTEQKKGKLDLSIAKAAIPLLRKNNLQIRGHTVFWGKNNLMPPWIKKLPPEEVMKALDYRIKHTVEYFGNNLSHWDVNNENLDGDVYEGLTGNPNITTVMFQKVHVAVPLAKLFINDNSIVQYSKSTVAIADQAKLLLQDGAPLYGIGIQSHLRKAPAIHVLQRRLDEVAKSGLPIWITEMTYENPDFANRTAVYEDLLRVYFSHPAVEGILFWVISNNGWRPNAALLDANMKPNPTGQRYLELRKQWSTPFFSHRLKSGETFFRAFHGNYRLQLQENGKVIFNTLVKVRRGRQTVQINLSECTKKTPSVIIG